MILKIAVLCTVKGSMEVLFTRYLLKVTWMGLSTNVSFFLLDLRPQNQSLNDDSAVDVYWTCVMQVYAYRGNQLSTRNGNSL